MNKKMMKRSLALGALMAFVITGSAMAADESYGSTILDKDVTVVDGNLIYTADKNFPALSEGANRSYGLAVEDGGSHTIKLDEGKTLYVNNSLDGAERNYGIALGSKGSLTINGDVVVNSSAIDAQSRAIRSNNGGTFIVNGNLNIMSVSENNQANGFESWGGGINKLNGSATNITIISGGNSAGITSQTGSTVEFAKGNVVTLNIKAAETIWGLDSEAASKLIVNDNITINAQTTAAEHFDPIVGPRPDGYGQWSNGVYSNGGGKVVLNGDVVNITAKTDPNDSIDSCSTGVRGEGYGDIKFADNVTSVINASSNKGEAIGIWNSYYCKGDFGGKSMTINSKSITGNAIGTIIVWSTDTVFNAKDVTINVESRDGKASAIEADNHTQSIDGGNLYASSGVTFNGNASFNVHSTNGEAYGIYAHAAKATEDTSGDKGSINNFNKDTKITATSDNGAAVAVFASGEGYTYEANTGKEYKFEDGLVEVNLNGASELKAAGKTASVALHADRNAIINVFNAQIIEGDVFAVNGGKIIIGGNGTFDGDKYEYHVDSKSSLELIGGTLKVSSIEKALTGEGKLVLKDNGVFETMSGQIFEQGIDQTSDKTVFESTESGKINDIASSKLEFEGGSVVLNDAKYSDAYVQNAKAALGEGIRLTMNGTLVTEEGVNNQSSVDNVAAKGENVIQTQVTAKADQNLLIGKKLDHVENVEGIKVKDSVENGFGVAALDMAAGSTGMIITDNAEVTLVGTNGELVTVDGKAEEALNVFVGTTELVDDSNSTAGILNVGNVQKDSTLTGNVAINGKDSALNVTGNTSITGDLILNNGTVNAVEGNLGAIVIVKEGTKDSTITGNVSGILSVEQNAILNVGTADASASTSFENVQLNGSTVCFDPDWDKAAGQHGWAFKQNVDGNILGARNNYVTIGDVDTTVAKTMFEKTGLKFGEKDITAVLYLAGNQTLADNGSIYVDGSKSASGDFGTATAGSFNAAANSVTMVDGSKIQSTAALSGVKESSVDENAKLYIDGAKKNETYKILAGTGINGVWEVGNILSDNSLLKFEAVQGNDATKFDVTATLQKVNAAYDNQVIIGNIIDHTLDKHEDSVAAGFFMGAVSDKVNASKEAQISALNSAGAMNELAGVAHSTYAVSNILTDAVADHVSLSNEYDHDSDIWAHYVHNKENVEGLAVANFGADYDAQYNGIVVGGDFYKKDNVVAGAALTYVDGNINGSTLAARTENDAEFYGVSVYGSVTDNDNAVIGDISYLHGKHDITQRNSGVNLTGDPETDAFSVGVRVEKEISAKAGKFVPYAGIRYMHVGTANYTNSIGMSYDADDANLFLLPVGLKYSTETKAGKWTFRPVAEVGYVWAIGDTDSSQTVSLNGAADGFGYDVTDDGSYFARVGVEAESNNVTYGLGYEYQKGDSVKANKWMANLNFKF